MAQDVAYSHDTISPFAITTGMEDSNFRFFASLKGNRFSAFAISVLYLISCCTRRVTMIFHPKYKALAFSNRRLSVLPRITDIYSLCCSGWNIVLKHCPDNISYILWYSVYRKSQELCICQRPGLLENPHVKIHISYNFICFFAPSSCFVMFNGCFCFTCTDDILWATVLTFLVTSCIDKCLI